MPILSISKTYLNGNTLFQADLDNAFNSITTFLNTTGLDSTNIQTGGIIGTDLANNTITATQIANGAINTAQLASSAVTRATLSALGQVTQGLGNSSANFSSGLVTAPGTLAITTTGRPVMVMLSSAGPSSAQGSINLVQTINGNTNVAFYTFFYRDNNPLASFSYQVITPTFGTTSFPGSLVFLDTPPAGAHTYNFVFQVNSTFCTLNVTACQLQVYEL